VSFWPQGDAAKQRDEFALPPAARCTPEAAGRRHAGNDIAVLQGSGRSRVCGGIDFTKFIVEPER
jgi:hypothetical protein